MNFCLSDTFCKDGQFLHFSINPQRNIAVLVKINIMLVKSLSSHLKGHIRVGSFKGLMKKSQTKLSVINMAQRPICAGVR